VVLTCSILAVHHDLLRARGYQVILEVLRSGGAFKRLVDQGLSLLMMLLCKDDLLWLDVSIRLSKWLRPSGNTHHEGLLVLDSLDDSRVIVTSLAYNACLLLSWFTSELLGLLTTTTQSSLIELLLLGTLLFHQILMSHLFDVRWEL